MDPLVDTALQQLMSSIAQVLLGKEEEVRLALCCLLAGGHLLIEDRPGVLFGCSDHCWKRLICLHLSAEVAIAKNVHVWLSTTLLATRRAAVVADPMAIDGTSQL